MLNFNKFKKKYVIKVPQNVTLLYCDKKNIITFIGAFQTKSLKLDVKIFLISKSNLVVSNLAYSGLFNMNHKVTKKLQGTAVAKIRHALIDTTYTLYHRLNFVGVGYRVFFYDNFENQLYFKLGYSHLIYFKIPCSLKAHSHKLTKLFLFGNSSLENLRQVASQIRACKKPEPYKGKGILHAYEKVSLKKGKKV